MRSADDSSVFTVAVDSLTETLVREVLGEQLPPDTASLPSHRDRVGGGA